MASATSWVHGSKCGQWLPWRTEQVCQEVLLLSAASDTFAHLINKYWSFPRTVRFFCGLQGTGEQNMALSSITAGR